MLRAFCARWMHAGLLCWMLCIRRGVFGLIEIVEEQHCHNEEFRLTCRELDTHIAILEAWYTSTEDLLQNITSTAENLTDRRGEVPQNDAELNQVYVYSSPKHNGYYEVSNNSNFENASQWSQTVYPLGAANDRVNVTLDSVNDTIDMSVDLVNRSEGCGVEGFLRSYSSWKQGGRRTPAVVRDGSMNLRAPIMYRCTGVNHCTFILGEDYPRSMSWAPGILYIKYACFDDSRSIHFCNSEVTVAETGHESEGYIRTPGYPHFYIGGECRWRLTVHPEQRIRITFLDVSLRSMGPFESECTDYVTVIDSTGQVLLSSCDQVDLPLAIVSKSNAVEVIVRARSEGAFPKRGVLLHYKSINCVTLLSPSNGYLVYRNEKLAHYVCNINHVFYDTHERAHVTWCYDDNRWNDSVPSCIEDTSVRGTLDSSDKDTKLPPNEANMIVDIVIPSLLIAALFIGNAFIVLIIYKYRKRKTEDIEDEFNTIPLSVNGNVHSAGNAV